MTVVIDACVLFPTVLREITLGVAKTGAFRPLWSARILEEWRRAAEKRGPRDAEIAGVEIALATAAFPEAEVRYSTATEDRLSLPDPDDRHVLAAAVDSGANEILTLNIKDFPGNILAREGVLRRHPDEFLFELWAEDTSAIAGVVEDVLGRARGHGIDTSNPRALLKKARLPRLGKALFQV